MTDRLEGQIRLRGLLVVFTLLGSTTWAQAEDPIARGTKEVSLGGAISISHGTDNDFNTVTGLQLLPHVGYVATDAMEGDPFAMAIAHLVEQAGTWQGTAGQLLEALPAPLVRPPNWPKDATRASGRVKRLAPLLRSIGITVDDTQRSRDRHRHRLLTLTRAPDDDASASAPEQASLWPEVAPLGEGRTPPDQP